MLQFVEASRNLEYPEILTLLISRLSIICNCKTKPNHITVKHAGKPSKICFLVITDARLAKEILEDSLHFCNLKIHKVKEITQACFSGNRVKKEKYFVKGIYSL